MHAREPAALEDLGSALGFQERQAQQHDDVRAEIERVCDKLVRDLELGADENPIPLVRFRNDSNRAERRRTAMQNKKANSRKQAELSRKTNRPKKKR